MSDIFISYDDEDRRRVQRLVNAFEARGWSVWWDHHISAGEPFAQVIERELRAAACVVVAWTANSVQSQWVCAEADEARKLGTLVPLLLDRVDLPMPFGQIQTVNLVDWRDDAHPGFAKLVADLRERIGKGPVHIGKARPARLERSTRLIGVTAVVLLAVAALTWYVLKPGSASVVPTTSTPQPAAGPAETPDGSPRGSGTPGVPSVADARAGGHWQAKVKYPDGAVFEERFTFEVSGRAVSGTASMRGYGNRRNVLDGAINANRLSFRTTGRAQTSLFGGRDLTLRYNGTLEGDVIRFTAEEEGSGNPPVAFTAARMSAAEASRIASGGRRPRLSSMDLAGLYRIDHVRQLVGDLAGLDACYEAAEFDQVNHEFVSVRLTVTSAGAPEQFEMRPGVAALEPCVRDVLFKVEWGPTLTGRGGTMLLGFEARLPWNP